MKKALYPILLLFALTGCIERYYPQTEGVGHILSVDGIITNGITKIALSYTVGLNETLSNMTTENNALVYVESEDGYQSAMTRSSGNGNYLIETGELNADAKYRLVIQLDGEEYHSSYITPAITPPVDVSYKFDPVKNNISICITTIGNEHQHGFYLWSYKEDWEIFSLIYMKSWLIEYIDMNTGKWVTETFYNDLDSPYNLYYCWKADSSKLPLLGATEKLSENIIREKAIKTFNCNDDRIFELYRIKVMQNALNRDCYEYFVNLKKNTEQTGSILGTIPTELMGNIKCVTNSKIPVIGYVDVSTITTTELYLTDKYYDDSYREWLIQSSCFNKEFNYIYTECKDCTYYGTKRKPKDWPNDHQ